MRRYGRYAYAKAAKKRTYWWMIPAGLVFVAALLYYLGIFGEKATPAAMDTPRPAYTPGSTLAAAPAFTPSVTNTPVPAPSPTITAPGEAPLGKPVNLPNTRYELAAELHPSYDRLYAKLRVQYENTTPDTLYELLFHLYPNAYAREDGPGSHEAGGGDGGDFDAGRAIVSAVSLDGALAYFNVTDEDMLLHVPFVNELKPGDTTEVFIEFAVDVPVRDARFGKTEIGYQLGNFLPVLAVYQDGAWVNDSYASNGDPYYTESADYAVALTYPSEYTLGCTGSVQKKENYTSGLTTAYIGANRVRDFACTLTASTQAAQDTYEGVRIFSYALSEGSAQRGLELAKKALATMTPLLGSYPYETLTVSQVDMYYAGMEYPNLLMVQRELYLPGRELELEMTIVHELIHQWFYGVVGNDQINAPWIDEALTSYLSLVYFERAGNQAAFEQLLARYIGERAPQGGKIDGKVSDYQSEEAYINSVYWRGAAMYHALREEIGDDAFFKGLLAYVQDNAYHIATKADIVAAFEKSSGRDLAGWFDNKLSAAS